MSRTIIGITSSREKTNSSSIQIGILETYLSAITNAGGIPLPIPLGIPNQLLDVLIQFIDGILFTGGGDIQPMLYKGKNHSSLSGIDSDRDRIELYLLKHAVKDNKPILGICRGIQLINVGMGGSLYEDILSQVPSALQHQTYPEHKPDFLAHEVKIETGTLLMEILGKKDITSILIEGGSRINTSAFKAGIVDKVIFFYAPRIIGGKNAPLIVGGNGISKVKDSLVLHRIKTRRFGDDIMVEGYT